MPGVGSQVRPGKIVASFPARALVVVCPYLLFAPPGVSLQQSKLSARIFSWLFRNLAKTPPEINWSLLAPPNLPLARSLLSRALGFLGVEATRAKTT